MSPQNLTKREKIKLLEEFIQGVSGSKELKRGLAVKLTLEGYTYNAIIAVFSRMRGNKILEKLTLQDSNTPHSCDYRYNKHFK